jgi:two-component system cell cycle response regulator DivK
MSKEKILVVEDNPMNMELFKDLLEVQGYEVHEATNAQEALDQVKSNEFDLILMDVQLPGMDGLSATKMIKEAASIAIRRKKWRLNLVQE